MQKLPTQPGIHQLRRLLRIPQPSNLLVVRCLGQSDKELCNQRELATLEVPSQLLLNRPVRLDRISRMRHFRPRQTMQTFSSNSVRLDCRDFRAFMERRLAEARMHWAYLIRHLALLIKLNPASGSSLEVKRREQL